MTPATFASSSSTTPNQYSRVHWASSAASGASGDNTSADPIVGDASATNPVDSSATTMPEQNSTTSAQLQTSTPTPVIDPALIGAGGSRRGTPALDGPSGLQLPGATTAQPLGRTGTLVGEDDGEQDDELLPAMADDDYSAQLSFQSQSKDNLKVLMDNFSPAQYDRFEAYRRHALPKQAVRKVIQQTLGHQVSQPVAQIIAGFSKVFVGEIVEKARAVQARRGETGPLSPDHLREAYRAYQQETGHVGAARPLRAKKLFVR
ncbi:hTAFII28-like protein conserved region-domain-containing protein [Panaeolus papilionaceus]|nr:hTAFII28-like protein conserved region-domain-containing protein [Panaeolus papilionaceus]